MGHTPHSRGPEDYLLPPSPSTPPSATSSGDAVACPHQHSAPRSVADRPSSSLITSEPGEKRISAAGDPEKTRSREEDMKQEQEQEKKAREKELEADAIPPVSFLSLFGFSKPLEIVAMIIGIVLAVAAGSAQPVMTIIFGRLTLSFTNFAVLKARIGSEGLTPETAMAFEEAKRALKHDSGRNALYLMAIGGAMFLTTWAFMLIWNTTGELNAKRVRENYLAAVLRQEIAYFDDLGAGEVATRIQNDCHLFQEGTSEKVALAAQYLGTFFSGFIIAFIRSWRLTLVLCAVLPPILLSGMVMDSALIKWGGAALEHIAKAGSLAEEVISSVRTVYAFGRQKALGDRFDEHIDKSRAAGKRSSLVESSGLAVMFLSLYAAYALAFFYGGILITQGRANSGIVINVFMAILTGFFMMTMLPPAMIAISKARSAAAKLFHTIDRVPVIDSSSPEGDKPDVVHGEISFEGVKFHYPSRPDVAILKGLTVTFEAGKTFALVGASGSGKSTVVSLVERFYDPIAGVVKLDGRDIKTLNLKWLRQQIGLVSQEPTLFGTTIRGNVEHGLIGTPHESASPEDKLKLVQQACISANAHDFITKLPNGYDTMVGERAMLLSGGQKQRIAIARAIVSDPRILLLDEATSALDTLSEGVVQDALDKAARGRTTITIAHRLSTVRDADMILVMGGGEILEQGTHNELLADNNGPYAQLVNAQKLAQEAAKESSQPADLDPSLAKTETDALMPALDRSTTGKSLSSLAMGKIQDQREADAADQARLPPTLSIYKRLLKMYWVKKRFYITGAVCTMASGMVYPAVAILFGKTMADFEIQDFGSLRHALDRKALWYFIIALLAALAMGLQNFIFSATGWDLNAVLRKKLFAAVLKHDVEWFDDGANSTGAVTSNIANQPQKVQGLFGNTLGSIFQSAVTLVGGCIVGLCYAPLLALVGIACIPILISGGWLRLKVVVLKDERLKAMHSSSAHLASEAAGAVRTVASLTRENDVSRIYGAALQEPMRMNFRTSIKSQGLYALTQGLTFWVIALVFYVGALWIVSGRYETSGFYTVLEAVVFASIEVGNIFSYVPDASKAASSAASIFRTLDYAPRVDPSSSDGRALEGKKVEGHVKLDGVHFRYPTRPGVPVLRGLDIDVPPGAYVALVGPSGCGKSTTIQLLERFYDPLIGRVILDGTDLREMDVARFRKQVALVSQEPTLYSGTIWWNVAMGAGKPVEDVGEDEVVRACKDANIYDFIMSLPDGFQTETGSKGTQLSGGQRQRLALARALIRNPKVLLLDEATSALDSQSERVVQEALDKAAKGRTTIVVAHRLSTVQHADRIYYFSEGRVAEQGTHEELVAMKGGYYELVQMQSLSKQ
ncbi:hypothetical protein IAT38_008157 [Cryptococcus sp. DSM 104549]